MMTQQEVSCCISHYVESS